MARIVSYTCYTCRIHFSFFFFCFRNYWKEINELNTALPGWWWRLREQKRRRRESALKKFEIRNRLKIKKWVSFITSWVSLLFVVFFVEKTRSLLFSIHRDSSDQWWQFDKCYTMSWFCYFFALLNHIGRH